MIGWDRDGDTILGQVIPIPRSVSYLRCHKKMSVVAKSLVERFEEEDLPIGKVAAIFNNGESSFSHRDCWNHVRNLRRKNLDVGDAQATPISKKEERKKTDKDYQR
ncbi:hypothetical protein Lal_00043197 [Lupinus albus]|nr:hypothetical protein Lal_00043197 [Lupinus albus]